jgi:serine protease Do
VKPGTTIPITLIRDGKRRTVNVTVGTRPSAEELRESQMFSEDDAEDQMNAPLDGNEFLAQKLGLGAVAINPAIARQLGVSADTRGLAIAAVNPNSDAARKGIQRRDIILSANYQTVTSTEQLESIVREAEEEGREAIVLRIQRIRGPAGYVAVRIQ